MNYAYIENGQVIDGPRSLPNGWRNVSGLNWLNDDELRALGWLPVRIDEGAVDEKFVGSTFIIDPYEVVEVKLWRAYTAEEKAEINTQKAAAVRRERNTKLSECDWTQLDDTPLENVAKARWANYRQALRDVPAQSGFPFNVIWPDQP
ncbi:MAG: hypothetical protein FJY48_06620 [Betaproteobacteria bacterium]|nr:hypothetical protein [Betaproteobacteria bacterium]